MMFVYCSNGPAASVCHMFIQACAELTTKISQMYHVTETQIQVWAEDPLLKDPTLCWEQRSFVPVCFHLQCPLLVRLQPCTRSTGRGISPVQWWSLWPTCGANLCEYSHQCHLTQECQTGLVGRAGPEVQVDPSETQRDNKISTADWQKIYIYHKNINRLNIL